MKRIVEAFLREEEEQSIIKTLMAGLKKSSQVTKKNINFLLKSNSLLNGEAMDIEKMYNTIQANPDILRLLGPEASAAVDVSKALNQAGLMPGQNK